MQINSNLNLNQQNFNGKLFFDANIEEDLVGLISKNKQIKKILSSSPNDLYVGANIRMASHSEIYAQGRDEVLTKIYFTVKRPVKSFSDKIKNFFARKRFLTSQYHSSQTNWRVINNDTRINEIVTELMGDC